MAKACSPPNVSAYARLLVAIAVLLTPPHLIRCALATRSQIAKLPCKFELQGLDASVKNRRVAALSETVEELRSDRVHGGSWMARRAVEALLEVTAEPVTSTTTLLERLLAAGR
jgi:hypothetical protein